MFITPFVFVVMEWKWPMVFLWNVNGTFINTFNKWMKTLPWYLSPSHRDINQIQGFWNCVCEWDVSFCQQSSSVCNRTLKKLIIKKVLNQWFSKNLNRSKKVDWDQIYNSLTPTSTWPLSGQSSLSLSSLVLIFAKFEDQVCHFHGRTSSVQSGNNIFM